MDYDLKDALVATSAAGAILWTGSLIVTQLADQRNRDNAKSVTIQPEPWRWLAFARAPKVQQLRTPAEVTSLIALSLLGFAIFAPIFALFLSGSWLRIAAGVFLALYAFSTLPETVFYFRARRDLLVLRDDIADKPRYLSTIAPYIWFGICHFMTIALIVAWPFPLLVLVLSIVAAYLGYQLMLGRYIVLRQPFLP